jgi:hypothetical protein
MKPLLVGSLLGMRTMPFHVFIMGEAHKVPEIIVERVPVGVMNFPTFRNRSVSRLPNLLMEPTDPTDSIRNPRDEVVSIGR